jgi:hypothetical protein
MEEVKLTKEQEILFEVYDKGVQNKDCDLDAYVEKMKQALSIAFVSQQRELFVKEQGKWLMANTNLSVEQIIDFEMEFINK